MDRRLQGDSRSAGARAPLPHSSGKERALDRPIHDVAPIRQSRMDVL